MKARREKLSTAIEAIEAIVATEGVSGGTVPSNGEVAIDSFFSPEHPRRGEVPGKKKKVQTATEIACALDAGGLTHRSKDLAATVYTTLKRDEDRGGRVVKVDKAWGLSAWYPGRPKKLSEAGAAALRAAAGEGAILVPDADEAEAAADEATPNPLDRPNVPELPF